MLEQTVQALLKQQIQIKLHLGCGPNLYDGWINVDGDYCVGQPGVIIHNITDSYPIPDNSVDEILTVHVIEHIPPGEVPAMIQEWRRILKPNGFVTTEWPDFLKMCEFIVADPSRMYSTNKKVQKNGLTGIYGNMRRYQDIAMLHKWGYSVESMCLLYKENGYRKTIVEDPKYRKTINDSRIVAYK